MNKRIAISLLLTTCLSACLMGPDYKKPQIKTLHDWKKIEEPKKLKLSADENSVKSEWWKNFSDEVLNNLIEQAEESNKDLTIAMARLKEARASRLAELSSLFPEISGNIDASRANKPFGSLKIINNSYQAGFDASWELDIFGGQQRKYEAAEAEVMSSAADLQSVLISLRAEVALDYVEYRSLQNQAAEMQENIKSLQDELKLEKQKFDLGVTNAADLAKASSLVSDAKAKLAAAKSALEKTKNNLSTLLGLLPGDLDDKLKDRKLIPAASKNFLLSTPAETIAARPDVKAAEQKLIAATSLQGAALADLFPKISLAAFFGLQDTTLSDRTRTWSVGTNVIIPIFSVGKVQAEIKASDANQQAALATYEKTVIAALAEIQTNLVDYANSETKLEAVRNIAQNSKKTLALTYKKFEQGEVSLIDVFNAEQAVYDAQNQQTIAEAEVAKSLIALNKSLGR